MAQQPLLGQDLPIIEASQSYSDTTLGRIPLHEWSAQRTDLYLKTHNTHKRQTSMPPAGFEPTIPASERPQTQVLDRAATGIGRYMLYIIYSISPIYVGKYKTDKFHFQSLFWNILYIYIINIYTF